MNACPKLRPLLKLICCAIFSFPFLLNAAIIYVNPSAAGANNGTSWVNAFTSLSSALLSAANGDEIWVKQGVYKPVSQVDVNSSGGADAREATFQIPGGVALYGGFTGSEVARTDRNSIVNLTILSGDLDNNDVNIDGNFIAENTGNIVGNNAYHVIYTSNVSANTIVDGFIITAGNATSADVITDPNQDGGGWYNRLSGAVNASSPTIRNAVFQGNYAASEGGAIYFTNAAAGGAVLSLIENCKFSFNKSNVAGGAINLGSFSAGNYQPTIKGCEFISNEAYRRGGAIYLVGDHAKIDSSFFKNNKVTVVSMGGTLPGSGGGVIMTASNALFTKCIFEGNNTTGNPTGAFEGGGGGAVYMSANEIQTTSLGVSEPKFISCGFYSNIANGNTAAWGGAAVHLNDGGKLRPKYINCVFSANQAQNDGGAVANFTRVLSVAAGFVPDLTPNYTNCTFTANHAARGGAIFNDGYVYLGSEVLHSRTENSILWNNTATTGSQISSTGTNVITYSVVQGSGGSGGGWDASIGTDGGNNLDVNPEFVNAADPDGADNIARTADDGLRLNATAAPVDEGNNAAAGLAGITTDYISAARILGGQVDMGAYERAGIVIPDLKIYWLKDWDIFKPICLSCPWAFLFTERIFEQFIWDEPAQLIDQDGTAIVTGHIVNRTNSRMGFQVYLKLVNKQNWKSWNAKGRTYTAFTWEAIQVAKKTHKSWAFWELSDESYLKGTDDLSGKLNLAHVPVSYKTGFQLGEGANGWDKDLGLSGTFSYKGRLTYKGVRSNLDGLATMNVDAEACKKGCVPLVTVTNSFSSMEKSGTAGPEMMPDKKELVVFPVPARDQLTISLTVPSAEIYTIRLYDAKGQLKKQQSMYTNTGNFVMSVKGLAAGVYVLQMVSNSGKITSKKVLIE